MPCIEHEYRRTLLDAVATLAGFRLCIEASLPDGSRPDVLRLCSDRRQVFIGEAKHTETPSTTATLVRLQRYLTWVVASPRSWSFLLVICHPTATRSQEWAASISLLAHELGLNQFEQSQKSLYSGDVLTWSRLARE